jgi:hypothetical protein
MEDLSLNKGHYELRPRPEDIGGKMHPDRAGMREFADPEEYMRYRVGEHRRTPVVPGGDRRPWPWSTLDYKYIIPEFTPEQRRDALETLLQEEDPEAFRRMMAKRHGKK